MQIFFKDKRNLFECKVLVEGADIKNTSARLVLKLSESKQNLLFYGEIKEDGHCSFDIPALKEVKDSKGEAIVEVIAESTYFEGGKVYFEIKQHKTIVVEMIERKKENSPKVIIESIVSKKVNNDNPIQKKLVNLFKESKQKFGVDYSIGESPSTLVKEVFEKTKRLIIEKDHQRFKCFLNKISTEKLAKINKLL